MRNQPPASAILPLLLLGLSLAGCDALGQARVAAKRTQMTNNLKQLGLAYHLFCDVNQKAPTGWQDVQSEVPPEVQQEVEAAGYKVNWGLKPSDATQGTSNTILAHQPQAATEGGQVLILDGSVQQLTGAEVTEKLAAQNSAAPMP